MTCNNHVPIDGVVHWQTSTTYTSRSVFWADFVELEKVMLGPCWGLRGGRRDIYVYNVYMCIKMYIYIYIYI